MAELKLISKGVEYTVLYDDDKHDLISKYKWHINHGYAVGHLIRIKLKLQKPVSMHRLLLGLTEGDNILCDHKNRVRTDNRLENIRICSHSDNAKNKVSSSATRLRGVYEEKKGAVSRFRAYIYVGYRINLGVYDTLESAGKAYDAAAVAHHKEFACLNFPDKAQ